MNNKRMNIDLKLKKEKRNEVIRWILYYLGAALCYVIITTLGRGFVMPLLLVPAAVFTAYNERSTPFYTALYGCVCGLLLDSAVGTLISFNGIILGFCSMMTSLFFMFYLRRHMLNFLLIGTLVTALREIMHYALFYLLWGYDENGKILLGVFLPEFILTSISGVVIFGAGMLLNKLFGAVTEHYIEETTEDKPPEKQ